MTLEPGTYEAGLEIFRNLREEDEWELLQLGEAHSVLTEMLDGSECFIARLDGLPVCFYGTAPGRGGVDPARLWLVTTPLVEKCWVHLARIGYDYVQSELRKHGVLECLALCRNVKSVRWLEWMGFSGVLEELPPLGQVIRFSKRL